MLIQAALLSFLPAPAPALAPQGTSEPPPGMVLVPGGRTKIGSTVKEIEAIGQENELNFPPTVCETPQHTMNVEDFFLMVNEVTNEQYAAFIEATGHKPPELWAQKAIDEEQARYVREQAEEIQKAKAEGKVPPERVKFDRSEWWRRNWEGQPWELPQGKESHPVVYVDYADAGAYARWAGLRLMTEFEYQRAGRGKDDNPYPWGDEFSADNAISTASRVNEVQKVGSRPGGAVNGIHDLAGNAWEWTSSPFSPYPKYEPLQIEIGRGKSARKIDGLTKWDPNQRVVVGGCFQNSPLVLRLTTRRPTDRSQSTDSMGFRCAASTHAGLDLAEAVIREDVPLDVRANLELDTTKVLAMDRWQSSPGTAGLEGYAVIEAYEYMLFVPAMEIDAVALKGLGELSIEEGPVVMGVLSTTGEVLEPALPAGTYLVSYRGAGVPEGLVVDAEGGESAGIFQDQDEDSGPVLPIPDVPEGYDWSKPNLIFYSGDGTAVAALPDPTIAISRPKKPTVLVGSGTREIVTYNEKDEPETTTEPVDQVRFNVNSWVRVSNKGFNFDLVLKFKKDSLGSGWRK